MDRIVTILFLVWLAVMVVGIVIALLPVIAFITGYVGVVLVFALLGRFVASLFC